MYGCLLLLALVIIIPSAPQQQTKTVDQKLVALTEWLGEWRTYSNDAQLLITGNQVKITDNQDDLVDTLDKVVAEA